MENFDELTYGERIAEVYDQFYLDADESTIDLLEDLADGGKVLELGIGTGRMALPLHKRGITVVGIDSSPAMITKLREKPSTQAVMSIQHESMRKGTDNISMEKIDAEINRTRKERRAGAK
ncbi:MAG TPA: hypothetical protein DCY61_00130 [Dehalococcoidia bacterium]|nr:hypothetical protein [Dehalococcoidia bacterium]